MSEKEYSNINTARRAAVSKAWANERSLVMDGKGTRDWSRSQQAEIVATGKCKGYFGHHKCSVSKNPKEAGNKDNIQFLNSKEHFDAHNGNYKNDPHGRYDPESKKVTEYKDNIKPEPVVDLSQKMAESRKQSSITKYDSLQKDKADKIKENAAKRAQAYEKRSVEKFSNTRNGEKTSKALRASKAHTVIQILIGGGNLIMTGIMLFLEVLKNIFAISTVAGSYKKRSAGSEAGVFLAAISAGVIYLWTKFCMLILRGSSRANEYAADAYAFEIGYGDDLAEALDRLTMGTPQATLLKMLSSTHPEPGDRIGRLQSMGATYSRY